MDRYSQPKMPNCTLRAFLAEARKFFKVIYANYYLPLSDHVFLCLVDILALLFFLRDYFALGEAMACELMHLLQVIISNYFEFFFLLSSLFITDNNK